MKLARYSNDSGSIEFLVMMDNDTDACDFEDMGGDEGQGTEATLNEATTMESDLGMALDTRYYRA